MPTRQKNTDKGEVSFFNDEEKAFDFFFRKYFTALCFFANSIIRDEDEAKDIVQNCFVKLWDTHSFEDRQETLKSFLYSSVRNACIDFIRKKKVREKAKLNIATDNEDEFEYFEEVAFSDMLRQVMEHMQELPVKMQQILKMHYLQGKKYQEIAEDLDTSPDAIRMQKARALQIIRRKLLLFIIPFFLLLGSLFQN